MKRILLLSGVLASLSLVNVKAQDNPNQARIDEIEAQIKELQAELKELKGDSDEVIGSTHEIDDLEITINDIYLTEERSSLDEETPNYVIVVDYTIKNNRSEDYSWPMMTMYNDNLELKAYSVYPITTVMPRADAGKEAVNVEAFEVFGELGNLSLRIKPIYSDNSVELDVPTNLEIK